MVYCMCRLVRTSTTDAYITLPVIPNRFEGPNIKFVCIFFTANISKFKEKLVWVSSGGVAR